LIQLAEPNLIRSGVVKTAADGAGAAAVHNIRTSSGTFLERGQDAVVRGEPGQRLFWTSAIHEPKPSRLCCFQRMPQLV
jgi:hypothetical protein